MSCLVQSLTNDSFQEELYPEALLATSRILLLVYLLVLIPSGTGANLLVMILIGTTKKLQTLPFFVITELLCTDLVLNVIMGVSVISSAVAGDWVFGENSCIALSFVNSVASFVRASCIVVSVLDSFS